MRSFRQTATIALVAAACGVAGWATGCMGRVVGGRAQRPANAEVFLVARGSLQGSIVPSG